MGLSPNQLGWQGGCEQIKLTQNQLPAHKHAAALSSVSVKFEASEEMGTETVPGTNSATTLVGTGGKFPNSIYNSTTPTIDLKGISINSALIIGCET